MLAIARRASRGARRLNAKGEDETIWLKPIEAIAESGRSPARHWLDRYEQIWGRSVDPAFVEAVF